MSNNQYNAVTHTCGGENISSQQYEAQLDIGFMERTAYYLPKKKKQLPDFTGLHHHFYMSKCSTLGSVCQEGLSLTFFFSVPAGIQR